MKGKGLTLREKKTIHCIGAPATVRVPGGKESPIGKRKKSLSCSGGGEDGGYPFVDANEHLYKKEQTNESLRLPGGPKNVSV